MSAVSQYDDTATWTSQKLPSGASIGETGGRLARKSERQYTDLSPYIYAPLILTSTLLQKFALPGTGNAISVGTLVMPAIIGIAWFKRQIIIDAASCFLFGVFIAVACFTTLTNTENGCSISALALVLCAQLPLTTRRHNNSRGFDSALEFYCSVMVVLCGLGIIQFASQWALPQQLSFPLDHYLPSSIRIDFYNSLNPLEYGADKLKSNGVFFAEPSFFSQAAALAAIYELSSKKRVVRLILLLGGLFVSYSGTGMMLLVPFGLYHLCRGRSLVPLVACLGVGLVIIAFGSALRLDAITDRFDEFMVPGSSGYARFISIFDVIRKFQSPYVQTTLFGLGIGQVATYIATLPYEGFGPTWGKIFFEYGLVGSMLYAAFMWRLLYQAQSPLSYPLLLVYLFMGGYVGDTAVLIPMLLFISWAPRKASEPVATSDPASASEQTVWAGEVVSV